MCNIYNIKGDPFSKLSAEEELEALDSLFYKPAFYNELMELAKNGNSRFILGQRGDGKSSIIYKLEKDLKNQNTLPILITRYDGFPGTNNECYFLYTIIQSLTFEIAKHLFEKRKDNNRLNKVQKAQLSLFIQAFYDPQSAPQFVELAKVIRAKKNRKILFGFINSNIRFLNKLINNAIQLTSSSLNTYLQLNGNGTQLENLLGEFSISDINTINKDDIIGWGKDKLVKIIYNLKEIAISLGYRSVIILFDKIDECQLVGTDVEKVAEFTAEILTDTDFLYMQNISIVFSLWSEMKNSLGSKGVRYDKFKCIDIRWDTNGLEKLIDKRLLFYSIEKKNPVCLKSLIPDEGVRNDLLILANKSPRSLISLLEYISCEDNRIDIVDFSLAAVSKGAIKFCKEFDYESLLPSRLGKSTDLINWIDKVLAIKRVNFSLKEASLALGQTLNTTQQYVDYLKKISIIKDSPLPDESGKSRYDIIDPKIKYLVSRGVTSLDR